MINLWTITAIDQHAHNLLTPEAAAKAIQDGDLTAKEAESVAMGILCDNARVLYGANGS